MVGCIQISQFVLLLAGHSAELPMKIDLCKTWKINHIFCTFFMWDLPFCSSAVRPELTLPWNPASCARQTLWHGWGRGLHLSTSLATRVKSAQGPRFFSAILWAAQEQGIQMCTCEIPSSPHICMKIPDLFKWQRHFTKANYITQLFPSADTPETPSFPKQVCTCCTAFGRIFFFS